MPHAGRIQAHRFGDDVARVAEIRQVVERGRAAGEDGLEFGVELGFDVRILR